MSNLPGYPGLCRHAASNWSMRQDDPPSMPCPDNPCERWGMWEFRYGIDLILVNFLFDTRLRQPGPLVENIVQALAYKNRQVWGKIKSNHVMEIFYYLVNRPHLLGNPFVKWKQTYKTMDSRRQGCEECKKKAFQIQQKLRKWRKEAEEEEASSEKEDVGYGRGGSEDNNTDSDNDGFGSEDSGSTNSLPMRRSVFEGRRRFLSVTQTRNPVEEEVDD